MAELDKPKEVVNNQINRFWSRLTRMQRLTFFGVGIITIGGLIALIMAAGSPAMSVLAGDLNEASLAALTEKLEEAQIQYNIADNGRTLMVPKDNLYDARMEMAREGLSDNGTLGYELFDEPNLGMSDFVQKLNYRRALEGELSRTISALEEVRKSRVHIVIPERALFEKDQNPPTASVVLTLSKGRTMSQANVEGVQNLVASSIEGMDATQVVVIDNKGNAISDKPRDPNSLAGLSSTQYELKQKVETYLARKAKSLLDPVIGVQNSSIRVDVELDFTQVEKTVRDFDPDRSVVLSEQSISEQSSSEDSLNYPSVAQEAQRGNSIVNYEVASSVQNIVGSVGAIKRLTVAAFINGTNEVVEDPEGLKTLEYKPREEEEMNKFRQIIRNAVGFDPLRDDNVSVVNIPFDVDSVDELPQPTLFGIPVNQQLWVERGILILAMLLAVLMMRKLIASPEVRSRIEQVLAPSDLDRQRAELARTSVERQQQLLEGLSQDADLLTAGPQSEEDKMKRARTRLDLLESPESEENKLIAQEMKERVHSYIQEMPEDASRLLKSMLRRV